METPPFDSAQDVPLLRTKLYIPPVRPKLVSRPRLIERLNAGPRSGRKLTLVSAPAGFGKTTLLSEWVNQVLEIRDRGNVAWLSLDEGDNDLTRFLTYVIAALQTVHAAPSTSFAQHPVAPEEWTGQAVGEATLAALQLPQLPPSESLLATLINDITGSPAASAPPSRSRVLVLDDYHVIEDQSVHQALAFLLEHLPTQMHLVVASRTDPPLPLPRLRVRGQLTELRSSDLRFTLDEAAAFLNRVMGLDLSTDDVAALEARTEGWIAGLQLAALSMQGRKDVRSFVRAFTGSHRYILDYLADEVLDRQPERVRTFLLQTAVLERLSGELCDAVTGREDGQATLEILERANLFVVPLDDERRWYRYHQLFADLLRDRLARTLPDRVPKLQLRACEWYAQNGRVYEALGYALAAGDVERAARLVEETDLTIVMRGELATLLSWLDMLPDEVVRSRPRLSLAYAWALHLTADVDGVEPRLRDALRAVGVNDDSEDSWPGDLSTQVEAILGQVAALRVFLALYRGDAQRAIELSQQALARLPEDNLWARAPFGAFLGDAYRDSDEIAAACEIYSQTIAFSQAAGNTLAAMIITDDLARLQVVQGQLFEAARTFRKVLQWGSGRRQPLLPVAKSYVGLGDLLREWNDLDGAEHYLREGVAKCKGGGYVRDLLRGYLALARVGQARGDVDGALDWLQKAEQLAARMGTDRVIAHVAAHQARLWLVQADPLTLRLRSGQVGSGQALAAARRWAQTSGLGADDPISYPREFEYLTWVRLLIAEGKNLTRGDVLLARLLQAAETAGRWGSVIEILTLQALALGARGQLDQALGARGQLDQAMSALERALRLAKPEGYVRLFVDEGPPMVDLLRRAVAQGMQPDYVDKLLAALREVAQLPTTQPRVEPLTQRELEVLRLIAAGLSNQELSETLVLALSTVKKHLGNIYGKLDVHSRTQAVHRARDLGLL